MPEQLPTWLNVGVEPPEILKNNGWQPGMKPAAQHMNWLFNRIYVVLKELQEGGNLSELKTNFEEHIAEDNLNAHQASNISFTPPSGMEATTLQDALIEVFQGYSSKISDLVDELLLIDPSLPLTQDSTFQEILNVLQTQGIVTGKEYATGKVLNLPISGSTSVTGLDFIPTAILVRITYMSSGQNFQSSSASFVTRNRFNTGEEWVAIGQAGTVVTTRPTTNSFVITTGYGSGVSNVAAEWIALKEVGFFV